LNVIEGKRIRTKTKIYVEYEFHYLDSVVTKSAQDDTKSTQGPGASWRTNNQNFLSPKLRFNPDPVLGDWVAETYEENEKSISYSGGP
jgi:hypothetical protein